MATTLASAAPARLAQPRFSLSHLLALLLCWAMT